MFPVWEEWHVFQAKNLAGSRDLPTVSGVYPESPGTQAHSTQLSFLAWFTIPHMSQGMGFVSLSLLVALSLGGTLASFEGRLKDSHFLLLPVTTWQSRTHSSYGYMPMTCTPSTQPQS